MGKVLIVDDQAAVRIALEMLFEAHGLATATARDPAEALRCIAEDDIGVVVQDMNFAHGTTGGEEGVELHRAIRRLDPELPVILMTAWTSLETAVQLVKEGAADYVAKPWDDAKLVNSVRNLLRLRELALENERLRAQPTRARAALARTADLRGLVYASPRMHEAVTLAVKVAAADVPVLVTGPNGAGKEQIAEIIQANSRRRGEPFVKVNAGGLPEQLLEAELFGAEAGAFTGAAKLRVGRFEEASGGTLFLDEIGNLSLAGQMKLLRVLQTGEFQRLGSNVTRRTDVRIVSATNADLPRMIREGQFREDLYYRLAVIELALPALRERPEDVPLLAEHFLQRFVPEGGVSLSPDARQALAQHDWPGNVRELQNRLQRAALTRTGATISAADLGLVAAASPVREAPSEEGAPVSAADVEEREQIETVLRECGGVVSRAAARLGLSRQAFYRRLDRLGLSVERRLRD